MTNEKQKRPERSTAPSAITKPDRHAFPAGPFPAIEIESVKRAKNGTTTAVALIAGHLRIWLTSSTGRDGAFVAPSAVRSAGGRFIRTAILSPMLADLLRVEIERFDAPSIRRDFEVAARLQEGVAA